MKRIFYWRCLRRSELKISLIFSWNYMFLRLVFTSGVPLRSNTAQYLQVFYYRVYVMLILKRSYIIKCVYIQCPNISSNLPKFPDISHIRQKNHLTVWYENMCMLKKMTDEWRKMRKSLIFNNILLI